MNDSKHSTVASSDNFAAQFAASHFTILAKLRQRVLDAADKPDLSLSEVDKAVSIEIKIANYLHKVKEREQKSNGKAQAPLRPIDQPIASTTTRNQPGTTQPKASSCADCSQGYCIQHGVVIAK